MIDTLSDNFDLHLNHLYESHRLGCAVSLSLFPSSLIYMEISCGPLWVVGRWDRDLYDAHKFLTGELQR